MDVTQEINLNAFIFTLPHSFLLLPYLKPQKKLTGARGRYRHNGLRMNIAQDVTDITYQHMYGLISYAQTDLEKVKGLFIKIKDIKGFSAKLKVLKDCNEIKGF